MCLRGGSRFFEGPGLLLNNGHPRSAARQLPRQWDTEAAGVSHDSPRAQTCTFKGPGLQNTTKIQREDTQRGKKRTNFAAGEGKKRAKFWAVQGKGVQGKGGPGKGGPGKGGSRGTEHDQTKTLKPPHGNRETNTHATQAHTNTHKHTETQTNTDKHTHTHKHTQTHTQTHTNTHTNTHKHKSKSVWPKSVLAKVGHTTKTLTLAKVGLAKLGRQKGLAKVGLAKVGHDHFFAALDTDHKHKFSLTYLTYLSDNLSSTHKTFGTRSIFTLRSSTAEWRINTNLISHSLCMYLCVRLAVSVECVFLEVHLGLKKSMMMTMMINVRCWTCSDMYLLMCRVVMLVQCVCLVVCV